TAAFLQPYQDRFPIRIQALQATADGLVLHTAAGTRILWGRPPGAERAGEASAGQKIEWLLDYCARYGGLERPAGPYEHDVRSSAQAPTFPVSFARDPPGADLDKKYLLPVHLLRKFFWARTLSLRAVLYKKEGTSVVPAEAPFGSGPRVQRSV